VTAFGSHELAVPPVGSAFKTAACRRLHRAAAGRARLVIIRFPARASRPLASAQTLLGRLELDGVIALMDALHTQVKTAHSIVQEGGGDFALFVKGNQAGLLAQAQHFLPEVFSPSTAPG
jgi:hypothetical protein